MFQLSNILHHQTDKVLRLCKCVCVVDKLMTEKEDSVYLNRVSYFYDEYSPAKDKRKNIL